MSQAQRRIMAGGVYQPRSKGAAMADALADARRSLARLLSLVILAGTYASLRRDGVSEADGPAEIETLRVGEPRRTSAP